MEECAKSSDSFLKPPDEGCKRTTAMHGHLAHDEKVWSSMLAHQDPADLALSCLLERQLQ
jgi:hypothetical protein